jgi:hypothetical protein
MLSRSRTSARPRRRFAPRLAACFLLVTLIACSGEAELPGDPLRIATSSLPDPVLGEAYRADVAVVGGLRPYGVRLDEGALPPGLALQGGVLVGTPSELGRFSFTLVVSDANLASTFERYEVTVRDLPVPRVLLQLPETEVRGVTELRGRVEDARGLRAVRLRLRWESANLELAEDAVRASRDDVAVLWRAEERGVAIDLAFLGEPFSGEGELFRLAVASDDALRLGMDLEVETLYADRHAFASRRLGVPPQAPSPGAPSGETGDADAPSNEDGPDPDGDDGAADGATNDEPPVEDAP